MNDFEKAQYDYENQKPQEEKIYTVCDQCFGDIYDGEKYYQFDENNYCYECESVLLNQLSRIAGDDGW